MTDLSDLKARAEEINALVQCDNECGFTESFADYLDRDDRVDLDDEVVEWECPDCGHETIELGKRRSDESFLPVIAVNGIEEFEQTFGE